MADFNNFGASDEENAEIKKLTLEVEADTDNFESWEKLIRACEGQEGGLNRNSSPQALATLRDVYDRFLLKFPLLFGYWKKYADLEFNISGPESAEMIYERGCASITNCVDLWASYCSFKMETTHTPHLVRELFERAANCVGLDFLAHPFWDKYIEYEERQEAQDKIFAILQRVIHIPMHQYARYFERFRQLAHSRPLKELVPAETLTRFKAEVETESAAYGGMARTELEVERDVRAKIDTLFYEIFQKTQDETNKRWTYESEIKRPYFHVTELENSQLTNWRKYLDFEEGEDDFARTSFLYERCIITCALYDEFWLRYARWMSAQPGKEEEVRHIYMRAATLFVPVSRPGVRLQFAYFEESCGRIGVATDIHEAILMQLPDCVEAIVSWANLERRQNGLDAAIQVYKAQIDAPHVNIFTKAVLVTRWAYLLWKIKGSVDEARTVFLKNVQWYADSRHFWEKWLQFELEQPTDSEVESQHTERVRDIFDELLAKSRISSAAKRELFLIYLLYLQERGGPEAMKQFLAVDREIYGPPSLSVLDKPASKENGVPKTPLDDATRAKAEGRYPAYYEYYMEPDSSPQGTAPFQ
ncbi:pre-mRNA-processing factor 39 [Annulohypoxylon maeteangense]|uniref:pre-mRNA-processing factor 39 n=1 Tax=Annulohypoxylon maeteangense TaxID=1927788 RepID=UPI002007E2DF|nr:pre-mRNA-processing factor 39 [Annulohypoxylon maeteangense]KAI0890060.1 pre-mRNA-processing factor 39 [Annulohypoxylon maeteangense]